MRWVIVAALFTVIFGISNPFAAFGVFLPVLSQTFGWSRGAISVALSINLLLGGVVGFAVGAIVDRHGPRVPLTLMAILGGAGFGLVSTVNALWQLYLYVGVMAGLGMSGFYVLTTATVARWFAGQRGLALGIVLTGFNIGYMTGGPLAALMIERFGWRTAYALFGGGFAVIGSLASLVVRFPSRSTDHAGSIEASALSRTTASANSPAQPGSMGLGRALADPRFWYLSGSWFLTGFVLLMMSVHVVSYATDRGLSLEAASLALTAYGIGAVGGRLTFGAAADRLGSIVAMRVCFALQMLALVPLLAGPSQGALLLALATLGLGFAGADTVTTKTVPDIFGVRALGSIMGALSIGWRCGAALGPAAAGYIRDATGSYAIAFGAAPVALVAGFILFHLSASRRDR